MKHKMFRSVTSGFQAMFYAPSLSLVVLLHQRKDIETEKGGVSNVVPAVLMCSASSPSASASVWRHSPTNNQRKILPCPLQKSACVSILYVIKRGGPRLLFTL